jgi:hypothetical protein
VQRQVEEPGLALLKKFERVAEVAELGGRIGGIAKKTTTEPLAKLSGNFEWAAR